MKIVLQRVSKASVQVNGETVGEIGKGFLLLVGITHTDTMADVHYMTEKILSLRVFEDVEGKLNLSLQDISGEILSVSQFTLYGDCKKGRGPSFTNVGKPGVALKVYHALIQRVYKEGVKVETGRFGAMMSVHLINDGPVTLVIETENGKYKER